MLFPTIDMKVHVLTKGCNAATFEIVFVCKKCQAACTFVYHEYDF